MVLNNIGFREVFRAVKYLNWYFTEDDGMADKEAVKAWEVLTKGYDTVEYALSVLRMHGWKDDSTT